jgi:endonuclease YncB( thermonuclease family)
MISHGDLYHYRAKLIQWRGEVPGQAWHDGDTFAADVDLGARIHMQVHVRCAGYNSPEVNKLATRQAGLVAKAYAGMLVPFASVVYLDSLAFEHSDELDDFGRMLARVWLIDGGDLAELMVTAGMAIPDPTPTPTPDGGK